ncbi:MAG: transcription elongation factor GreA [Campylobacteraceae bacterium]|jgi:transcription elongation factor GreA|nr:transcription elongation factor GreA [Campylobacteraceae bacterium]
MEMSVKKEPMTLFGFTKLEAELNDFKKVQRPQIVIEIDIARSHGDLKENAEYHAAREKQAFIEARIAEFTDMISRAQIIDPTTYEHTKVLFGSTVKLEDLDSGEIAVYTIVGAFESNPDKGLISISSPLAKQLIGKKAGDEVDVVLPNGKVTYEVLEVYFEPIKF